MNNLDTKTANTLIFTRKARGLLPVYIPGSVPDNYTGTKISSCVNDALLTLFEHIQAVDAIGCIIQRMKLNGTVEFLAKHVWRGGQYGDGIRFIKDMESATGVSVPIEDEASVKAVLVPLIEKAVCDILKYMADHPVCRITPDMVSSGEGFVHLGDFHILEIPGRLTARTVHVLKLATEHLVHVVSGCKKAEIRKNDRGYKVGDTIIFTCQAKADDLPVGWVRTALMTRYRITHILTHEEFPEGLAEGYVMLSIEPVKDE